MPIYHCDNCRNIFEEPHVVHTSYEAYYDAPVGGYTPMNLYVCPRCGNEYIEEQDADEFDDFDDVEGDA